MRFGWDSGNSSLEEWKRHVRLSLGFVLVFSAAVGILEVFGWTVTRADIVLFVTAGIALGWAGLGFFGLYLLLRS
ncbi:hypothetical protein [Natronolimnohabitans innermongolicus]|uniref:Uncharacterized protein n=1 Tax=Natronolimnohabitans innermongolicus JCM 12255 TaxID=1227499 RepID=L9WP38_9EURY|nr:hypothetical protein [Natronolimnohabitans innermongolicus]ELY50098.1 hypothetical protein C493_19706 [Natronolimnohabitans innermongolicus JCM 12255]